MAWGDPLRHVLTQPRTGLGVDVNGNLIFVASMTGVLPSQVGAALVSAGAVSGMELDMNPYWPIMGAASAPLHTQTGKFTLQLKDSQHSAGVFATGWQRDFFTVMAEPDKWTCNWQSPGLGTGTAAAGRVPAGRDRCATRFGATLRTALRRSDSHCQDHCRRARVSLHHPRCFGDRAQDPAFLGTAERPRSGGGIDDGGPLSR